jgi:hypothetical protein
MNELIAVDVKSASAKASMRPDATHPIPIPTLPRGAVKPI